MYGREVPLLQRISLFIHLCSLKLHPPDKNSVHCSLVKVSACYKSARIMPYSLHGLNRVHYFYLIFFFLQLAFIVDDIFLSHTGMTKCSYVSLLQIENVVLEVPFPKTVLNVTLTATQGKNSFDPVSKLMTWDVGKIDPGKLPNIKGNVSLSQELLFIKFFF